MHKLTFTLKQHTPLIHFQHDQAGATLRATEVKPKLDFFIMKKLLENPEIPDHRIREHFFTVATTQQSDGSNHQWKNWLIGNGENEHIALNYKLSFYCPENHFGEIQETNFRNGQIERKKDGKIDVKAFPGFFANNGKENFDDFKWFNWSSGDINAKIIAFDQTLKEVIEQSITAFFFHNNFGSRKTKGFGSFSVSNEDGKSKRPKDYSKYFFDITFKTIKKSEINDLISNYKTNGYGTIAPLEAEFLIQNKYLFERIDLLYRTLRSGINIKDRYGNTQFYIKSLLFFYYKVKFNKQWDKKSIKEYFYFNHSDLIRQKSAVIDADGPLNYTQPTSNLPNKLLIRDLETV